MSGGPGLAGQVERQRPLDWGRGRKRNKGLKARRGGCPASQTVDSSEGKWPRISAQRGAQQHEPARREPAAQRDTHPVPLHLT